MAISGSRICSGKASRLSHEPSLHPLQRTSYITCYYATMALDAYAPSRYASVIQPRKVASYASECVNGFDNGTDFVNCECN